MFYIFLISILNLALGFALAVYLGGQYRLVWRSGFSFGLSRIEASQEADFETSLPAAEAESSAPVEVLCSTESMGDYTPQIDEPTNAMFQAAAAELTATPSAVA